MYDDRFSQPVRDILHAGGWFEGRKVPVNSIPLPEEYILFPKAEEVIAEFEGLHLGESRRGVNCAACDIEIDPCACRNLTDYFKPYEAIVESRLYPLGYVEVKNTLLLIDEPGRIYLFNSYMKRNSHSFDHALELLLLGIRTDPIELAEGWGAGVEQDIRLSPFRPSRR